MDADRVIARTVKVLFEIGSILVGLGGVVYQLRWAPGGPDAAVLAILAMIAAAPIGTNLRSLYPGAGTQPIPAGSSPPPSQSPAEPSSPPSSSPSSTG